MKRRGTFKIKNIFRFQKKKAKPLRLPQIASILPEITHPTFQVYSVERNESGDVLNLNQNSIGDDIKNRYIKPLTLWMINSSNDSGKIVKSIRAIEAGIVWQASRNIIDLIDVRALFENSGDFCRQIDDSLVQEDTGALFWLLEQVKNLELNCDWKFKRYHTAIAVEALLRCLDTYSNQLSSEFKMELKLIAIRNLEWLINTESESQIRPWSTDLRIFSVAYKVLKSKKYQEIFVRQLENALLYSQTKAESLPPEEGLTSEYQLDSSVLNGFAFLLHYAPELLSKSQTLEIKDILREAVLQIEIELAEKDKISNAGQLDVYMFGSMISWAIASTDNAETFNLPVIFKSFSQINRFFFPTNDFSGDQTAFTFLLRLLVKVANSQLARIPVISLYESFLENSEVIFSEERREIYILRKGKSQLQKELDAENIKNRKLANSSRNRKRLLFSTWAILIWTLIFFILAPSLGIIQGLNQIIIKDTESFLALLFGGAIIVGAVWTLSGLNQKI